MQRVKQILVGCGFCAVLFGFLLATVLRPQAAVSATERRKLSQFPLPTLETLLNGKFASGFDSYAPDQFALREPFRSLAAGTRLYAFRQKDTNGVYLLDQAIYKLEYPDKPRSQALAAEKIAHLAASFPDTVRAYYAVIPDKNYYVAAKNGYPALDYPALNAVLSARLTDLTEIPLADCLTAEDYYRTDTHWRQERLAPVVDRLAEAMGMTTRFSDTAYKHVAVRTFGGVLYGQAALPVAEDTLTILTSDATQRATVYNTETNATEAVYPLQKANDMDPYDVFLSGAAALQVIENPGAATDRELVLFRDSFGSSLAPLLLAEYKKITLVDLRYISSAYLAEYVTFDSQDVLFLYSTLILNSGELLK